MSLKELVDKIKAAKVSKDSYMIIKERQSNVYQRVAKDAFSFLNITGAYRYTYPNGDILSDKYSTHGDVVALRTHGVGKIKSEKTDKNIWDVHGLTYNSYIEEFGFVSDLFDFYDKVDSGKFGNSGGDFSNKVGQMVVEWEQPTIITDVEIITSMPTLEFNDSYGHKHVGSYKFPLIAFIKDEKLKKEFYLKKVDEMK
jgi:hypothetical protein